jgi:hypothetical protein
MINQTKIVNVKDEKCDIYIGRGTKYGNPFKIGRDGTREEVIQKYEEYIRSNETLMKH